MTKGISANISPKRCMKRITMRLSGMPNELDRHPVVAPTYWHCYGCHQRWPRTKQKCGTEGCNRSRPKRREPKHAAAIRGDNYHTVYMPFAAEVHGVTDESCNLCGRPRGVGKHHRDHGHNKSELSFGKPRGILCFQCNNRLPREATEEWLHQAYLYLRRVRKFYELEEAA